VPGGLLVQVLRFLLPPNNQTPFGSLELCIIHLLQCVRISHEEGLVTRIEKLWCHLTLYEETETIRHRESPGHAEDNVAKWLLSSELIKGWPTYQSLGSNIAILPAANIKSSLDAVVDVGRILESLS
jgi:hypothetical protein